MAEIRLEDVKNREDIQTYIAPGDQNMESIGYTEHGFRHADLVAERAQYIMKELGRDPREVELAAIAGYPARHRQRGEPAGARASGGDDRLRRPERNGDAARPSWRRSWPGSGNHEEQYGDPFGPVAAAVIIADKSDVARTRVRDMHPSRYDEHDRVNYATISSAVTVNHERTMISLSLEIDTTIAPIMEYFELFLQRMVMARRAALMLGCTFELVINGTKLL